MNNQEAFDKALEHLRSLKRPSEDENGNCAYNGAMCAIGVLMTEDEQSKFGGFIGSVWRLLERMEDLHHSSILHKLDICMLWDIQMLHDNGKRWGDEGFIAEDVAEYIARKFNLIYTKP